MVGGRAKPKPPPPPPNEKALDGGGLYGVAPPDPQETEAVPAVVDEVLKEVPVDLVGAARPQLDEADDEVLEDGPTEKPLDTGEVDTVAVPEVDPNEKPEATTEPVDLFDWTTAEGAFDPEPKENPPETWVEDDADPRSKPPIAVPEVDPNEKPEATTEPVDLSDWTTSEGAFDPEPKENPPETCAEDGADPKLNPPADAGRVPRDSGIGEKDSWSAFSPNPSL